MKYMPTEKHMRPITLQRAADYLEAAQNVQSQHFGFCIVNSGTSEFGFAFVLVINMFEEAVLIEGM
jgi:hypothetical protein